MLSQDQINQIKQLCLVLESKNDQIDMDVMDLVYDIHDMLDGLDD